MAKGGHSIKVQYSKVDLFAIDSQPIILQLLIHTAMLAFFITDSFPYLCFLMLILTHMNIFLFC